MTTVRTARPSLNLHSQESPLGEKQEPAQGESAQENNHESTQRGHHESVPFNYEGNTRRLTLQKVICGGRGVSCIGSTCGGRRSRGGVILILVDAWTQMAS